MMESSREHSSADQAVALISAEASRDALARRFQPGVGWFALLAATIALHIALSAIGVAEDRPVLFIVGQVSFVVLTAAQIWWVSRSSGMRVGAFINDVVLGMGATASGVYAAGLAGAMWAAFESQTWLAVACAIAAGAGYALAGRRWVRRYHERPGDMSGRASTLYTAAAFVLAGVALVVLLVNR